MYTKRQTYLNGDKFYESSFRYRSPQKYIISSQTVVDLKRNTSGNLFQVYPSPATDKVSVRFDIREKKGATIYVYNSLGVEIKSYFQTDLNQVTEFKIDEQPAGNYYIRTMIDGVQFTKKLVKL
ncbi:MAG: T9SS type A sorting domain-containing protein [Bacteroidetes bacterium]|nr:T9SS type A sorting domain-containing protein [Bacteroidota bacterium]